MACGTGRAFKCTAADSSADCVEAESGCYDFSIRNVQKIRCLPPIPCEVPDIPDAIFEADILNQPWPVPPPFIPGCSPFRVNVTSDPPGALDATLEYIENDQCQPQLNLDFNLNVPGGFQFTMYGEGCTAPCSELAYYGPVPNAGQTVCFDIRDPTPMGVNSDCGNTLWKALGLEEEGTTTFITSTGTFVTKQKYTPHPGDQEDDPNSVALMEHHVGDCEDSGEPGLCMFYSLWRRKVLLDRCCGILDDFWELELAGDEEGAPKKVLIPLMPLEVTTQQSDPVVTKIQLGEDFLRYCTTTPGLRIETREIPGLGPFVVGVEFHTDIGIVQNNETSLVCYNLPIYICED